MQKEGFVKRRRQTQSHSSLANFICFDELLLAAGGVLVAQIFASDLLLRRRRSRTIESMRSKVEMHDTVHEARSAKSAKECPDPRACGISLTSSTLTNSLHSSCDAWCNPTCPAPGYSHGILFLFSKGPARRFWTFTTRPSAAGQARNCARSCSCKYRLAWAPFYPGKTHGRDNVREGVYRNPGRPDLNPLQKCLHRLPLLPPR